MELGCFLVVPGWILVRFGSILVVLDPILGVLGSIPVRIDR